jgi:hypothetical protein
MVIVTCLLLAAVKSIENDRVGDTVSEGGDVCLLEGRAPRLVEDASCRLPFLVIRRHCTDPQATPQSFRCRTKGESQCDPVPVGPASPFAAISNKGFPRSRSRATGPHEPIPLP